MVNLGEAKEVPIAAEAKQLPFKTEPVVSPVKPIDLPESKADARGVLESIADYVHTTDEPNPPAPAEIRQEEQLTNLEQISARNISRMRQTFIQSALDRGLYASVEEANTAIDQERLLVEQDERLSINLSAGSIERFFQNGGQETFWDHLAAENHDLSALKGSATGQSKNLHEKYIEYRAKVEESMGKLIKPEVRENHPLYTAVSGGTGRDHQVGASPVYGQYFLEVDADSFADQTVYHYNDSFTAVRESDEQLEFDFSGVLNRNDALTAKAMINLANVNNRRFATYGNSLGRVDDIAQFVTIDGTSPGYIEGLVFGEITPNQLKGVGCVLAESEESYKVGSLIARFPQLAAQIRFYLQGNPVGEQTRAWLETHFPNRVQTSPATPPALPRDQVHRVINPDSDYEAVTSLLNARSEELWRRIRNRIFVGIPDLNPGQMRIKLIRDRLSTLPIPLQEVANEYVQLEKEHKFFN